VTASVESDKQIRKDVFAYFGAAAYTAQGFEYEIITLLIGVYRLKNPNAPIEELDRVDIQLSKRNLGQLYLELKKHLGVRESFQDALLHYKERRNYLMHRFFPANAKGLATRRGCHKMIDELQDITAQLHEADVIAQSFGVLIRRFCGIPEEQFQKYAEAMLAKKLADEIKAVT